MRVIYSFKNLSPLAKNTALAIGNFDGLHLGHQKILKSLVQKAREKGLFSFVLTFSPHPEKILGKGNVNMIQTLPQRLEGMKKLGVQAVLITPFDQKFSNLSSRRFAQEVVVNCLKAKEVIVGENFRFGKSRKGDIGALRSFGLEFGFHVRSVPPVKKNGKIVSSSLIRNLLQKGKIEEANTMLGRFYEIEGKVIKGEARGKTIGYPTANIQTENEITPAGVFLTMAQIGSRSFPSLTNVGVRPTFRREKKSIESYIIDFDKNLYGRKVKIHFLKKIRKERKFKNVKSLSLQIQQDLKLAKNYFLDFFPEI